MGADTRSTSMRGLAEISVELADRLQSLDPADSDASSSWKDTDSVNERLRNYSRFTIDAKVEVPSADCLWVDISNAQLQDIELLQNTIGFHEITRDDIISPRIREKWEYHPTYLFSVLHEISWLGESGIINISPIKVLITRNVLLTMHVQDCNTTQELMSLVFNKFKAIPPAQWCLCLVMHRIVYKLQQQVDFLGNEQLEIDRFILGMSPSHKESCVTYLIRLRNAKLLASYIFHFVTAKETQIKSLCLGDQEISFGSVQIYVRSLYHRLAHMKSGLNVIREMLLTMETTFCTVLNTAQRRRSIETGFALKRLAATSMLFLPGTFISGLFGMNVDVPEEQTGSIHAFIAITGIIIAIVLCIFFVFRKFTYL